MFILTKFYSILLFLFLFISASHVYADTKIVALLPMTGNLSLAGKEIAKAIQNSLNIRHGLVFVDRNRYPSLELAWKAVMSEKPDVVIGPLAPDDVEQLMSFDIKVPVISLNRASGEHNKVWQLGLPSEYVAIQLAEVIHDQGTDKVLLFLHDSAQSERLWKAFIKDWSGELVDAVSFSSVSDIKVSSRRLLHTDAGIKRILALRQTLASSVESYPWVRQDADVLLVVAPLHEAIDLSFRVDHLWEQGLTVYWLDSGNQSVAEFVSSSVNWGRMRSMMSPYLVSAMQRSTDVLSNLNFFRALGHDAALLSNLVLDKKQDQLKKEEGIQGALGRLSLEDGQKIGIELLQVWLGDGVVEAVE